ncbi:hypothetical protein JL2886_01387 [Phaeobacter gallaeciensis]|uniref:Uncharacterized protein n=1 Tax=Phaeobacter gallaeciensis TaxID=60890 RepID=A0A1B0ZQ59_9RHOB|nr:hypothetical protein JL2886_01387 [Phaeobacter gallaeciensis]
MAAFFMSHGHTPFAQSGAQALPRQTLNIRRLSPCHCPP